MRGKVFVETELGVVLWTSMPGYSPNFYSNAWEYASPFFRMHANLAVSLATGQGYAGVCKRAVAREKNKWASFAA